MVHDDNADKDTIMTMHVALILMMVMKTMGSLTGQFFEVVATARAAMALFSSTTGFVVCRHDQPVHVSSHMSLHAERPSLQSKHACVVRVMIARTTAAPRTPGHAFAAAGY